MKTLNFWRTLLFTVMAAAAFTACSDDEGKDGGNTGSGPKITVNGGKAATVAVDLNGGTTSEVTVNASGAWTMTVPEGAEWVMPSATSGKSGESKITFAPESNAVERQATVTVSTFGKVPGVGTEVEVKATITIKQNDGGSAEAKTNVAEIREAVKSVATQDGAAITEDLTLTGIVISDVAAGGTGGNKSCYIVDNTTDAGAGIIVRFANAYTYKAGDVVTGSIKGQMAKLHYGVLQVGDVANGVFSATGETIVVEPIAVAYDDLLKYESQLVKVSGVQPKEAFRGKVYCPSDAANYTTSLFETQTGKELQISVYKTNKWAQTTTIPSNSGDIAGVVTVNGGIAQVAPRNAGDVAGLTQPLFTASTPSITPNPTSLSFVVGGETKTVAFTTANIPAGNKIFAKVTGSDAAAFPVASGEVTSPISITVAANAGNSKAAVLRIYAAASEGGAEFVGVNVPLSQAGQSTGGEKTLDIVMKEYPDFAAVGTGNIAAGTMTVAPFTLAIAQGSGASAPKYYGNAGFEALRMYASNTMTITGATITKIEFTYAAPYQGANYNNLLTATGSIVTDSETAQTWTGSSSDIVFTSDAEKGADGKNKQSRISSMKITYTE